MPFEKDFTRICVAQASSDVSGGVAIVNTAQLDAGLGPVWLREAVAVVNGHALYLPLVQC
jgi:hypothetical protein